MLGLCLFIFSCSSRRFYLDITFLGTEHSLEPSIYSLKMRQAAHGYNRMLLKKAYQAYEQNDIKIAALFEP